MVYKYKGNKYIVLQDKNIEMKDPLTGYWIKCVVYVDYKEDKSRKTSDVPRYVRSKNDFEHKFELC